MSFRLSSSLRSSLVSALFLAGLAACTSSSGSVASPQQAAPASTDPAPGDSAPTDDAGTDPTPDACGPVKKSMCKPANEGSVVRGIVKFDPSKVKAKAGVKPKLRIFLHHQVIMQDGEEKLGGHPHAWGAYDLDMDKGEASFSIDLCTFGVAMYSEENCGFHIVAIIDDDGGNDPDKGGATALIPRVGKMVKMVPVDISCHKASPCLEITADCVDGDACTTYQASKKCSTCATDSCPSDDAICKI